MTTDDITVSTEVCTEPPRGFEFAGIHCGIKRTRPDVGVIRSRSSCSAAGCFTRNPVHAPCVDRNAEIVPASGIQAVLVTSGNANAMTGPAGADTNNGLADALAGVLGCEPASVLTASTGVIGVPLNGPLVSKALPRLVETSAPAPAAFAEAIVTTDTTTKLAHVELELPGDARPIRVLGVAKGSGMVHPDMATTLGFICTDAGVAPELLQDLLRESVEDTFNAITVDGDTSTNDMVLALANGESEVYVEGPQRTAAFAAALQAVLRCLAIQVASDGEGATRLLQVEVKGAADKPTARALARGICRSSLFKCSVFSGTADWGRLAAAAGQAALGCDAQLDPSDIEIAAQGVTLVERGQPVRSIRPSEMQRRLRQPEVRWKLRVGGGPGRFVAYGCDLSYDYVRINADEATQVEVSATGTVSRNLTLSAYSPRLKHQLLVDGLGYVRRFTGLRALVHVGGAAARRPDLGASIARDLALCLDAGLKPLVVVPSTEVGAAIEHTAREAGHSVAPVAADPSSITRAMDRGHLCVLVESTPDPGEMVDLAIKLGIQKLVALGDDQGLHDEVGLVSLLSPDVLLAGLERGRFRTANPEALAFARHAAMRGVPALHLIDGRIPHAVVGELFTEQGIGTLVTREVVV